MKNILEALAYGEINPLESFFERDSKHGKMVENVAECEQKLLDMLDGEARELFLKFSASSAEVNGAVNLDGFAYGYRLGALMMVEVFKG